MGAVWQPYGRSGSGRASLAGRRHEPATAPSAQATPQHGPLHANVVWAVSGNVTYAACQWGMLVLIARLGTPEMVGEFAFALALVAPIVVFAMLNLRTAQATDQRSLFAFADYVHLRLACLAVAAAVLAGVLAIGRFDRATVWTVALLGVAKAGDALSDVVYGLLQQQERLARVALSRALQGCLQLVALAIALTTTGSLVAGAGAMAAASLIVTLTLDIASVRMLSRERAWSASAPAAHEGGGSPLATSRGVLFRIAVRPDPRALVRLLVLSLPLGVAAALDSLCTSLPRWALEASAGRTALGYYAAASYFLIGQGVLATALADAVRPRLAREYTADRAAFRRSTVRLGAVVSLVSATALAGAIALGGDVLTFLYGDAYAQGAALLVWIMAAAVPWNLAGIATTAIGAARRFGEVSVCFVAMTVATGVGSLLLVPRYGAEGAAWALGLGMLVRLAFALAILARVWAPREQASLNLTEAVAQ